MGPNQLYNPENRKCRQRNKYMTDSESEREREREIAQSVDDRMRFLPRFWSARSVGWNAIFNVDKCGEAATHILTQTNTYTDTHPIVDSVQLMSSRIKADLRWKMKTEIIIAMAHHNANNEHRIQPPNTQMKVPFAICITHKMPIEKLSTFVLNEHWNMLLRIHTNTQTHRHT